MNYRSIFTRLRWPLIAVTILLILVTVYFVVLWREPRSYNEQLIADTVTQLKTIFERIDATCGIISFEREKNWIDFLNVVKFVGSEVGSLNLRNPQAWEGPYVLDNPTMQEREYQVVTVREGYAIVPGEGVRLPSGKVMGKDVLLDAHTDITPLIQEGGALFGKSRPLGARLILGTGTSTSLPIESDGAQEEVLEQVRMAE